MKATKIQKLLTRPTTHFTIKITWLIIVFSLISFKLHFFRHWVWLLFLAGGMVLGLMFILIDQKFLYRLYQPQTQLTGLISQSLMFLGVFIPLALFITTSSSSPIGIGFVIGFLTTTAVDMTRLMSNQVEFNQAYLYQFSKQFNLNQRGWITFTFVVITGILSLLIVVRI